MVGAGLAVAVVNYDLCPQVTIVDDRRRCRRAVAWLAREGGGTARHRRGSSSAGNSAGGHLAAMMFATDWRQRSASTAQRSRARSSLSGVHDLAPLVQFSFNADLKLDAGEALRLSPAFLSPGSGAPLLLAVGAGETASSCGRRDCCGTLAAEPAGRGHGPADRSGLRSLQHPGGIRDGASALTRETLALF